MGNLQTYTKDDKRILYFVSLVWGMDVLYYVKAVVMRLPVINALAEYFVPAVIVISLLCTLSSLSKNFKASDVLFYVVCLAVYTLTFVLFPANDQWLSLFLPMVFLQSLPLFYIGLSIDSKKQLDVIEYVSMAYIVLSLLYIYLIFSNKEVVGEEMGAAYSMLPHLLIVLYSCIRKFKWYSLVIVVLGITRLLSTGNRGTLLCVALFVVLYIVFCTKMKRKWLWAAILAAITAYVWVRKDVVFGFLNDFFGELGFSTRVFSMILNEELTDANGRDFLATFFMQKISEGGPFGYGICGDRMLLADESGYPHNLAIEFFVDYGYVLGSILLLAIAVLLLQAFIKCRSNDSKALLLIFITVGFVSLFLSNSYLSNPMFFLMLGYAVRIIRDAKRKPIMYANTTTI